MNRGAFCEGALLWPDVAGSGWAGPAVVRIK